MLAFHRDRVDGEDARRARDPGALHHELAHAAAAEHRHGGPGLDLGGPQGGAHAGGHTAADEGELLARQIGAHWDDGVLVHGHLLGERAQP
ncbi:hypothetical protein SVIO_103130 [Streptomyces violaceusniger]|uniref:Uncharacterized protein n=1 Tax=Streptomyces violaceusniger TaxID=68280 RepID=A0A4D4LKE6_STRVO|nr:hypothetical protein SVIO_103130 [Streptomyces violaceusniger]